MEASLAAAVIFPPFLFLCGMVFGNYQKDRISALFHPERDPWELITASFNQNSHRFGRIFGKGFKQGTQSQLGFCRKLRRILFSSFTENGDCWGASNRCFLR